MKPTTAHVLAVILFCSFEVLGFVQANPALATQLHITSQVLLVAGFVIALASKELFGTPTPQDPGAAAAAASAATKAVAVLFILGFVGGATESCRAVAPALDFAGCVWNTYGNEPTGTPISQVVSDEIAQCGGDAASVIAELDKKEPAALHASVAHAASSPAPAAAGAK